MYNKRLDNVLIDMKSASLTNHLKSVPLTFYVLLSTIPINLLYHVFTPNLIPYPILYLLLL